VGESHSSVVHPADEVGLTCVLQAVADDAHQADTHRDRWIPSTIDDPIEVAGRGGLEIRACAACDRVVVRGEIVRPGEADGADVIGGVAVPGVAVVSCQPEPISPAVGDVCLRDAGDLRDMVILDPREVPDEPPDGVGVGIRPEGESVPVDVGEGAVDFLFDPLECVGEDGGALHVAIVPVRPSRSGWASSRPFAPRSVLHKVGPTDEGPTVAWSTADIPDLTGAVAVVTGANSGLGLESARALAGAGALVVMAARDQDKARAAHDDILSSTPGASLEIVELDLASLGSVQRSAATIIAEHPTLHILMNNAGLMAMPERRTADGFEMQFGVNHLGHWVLTAGLMPALLAADAARVVTVTSTAHHFGRAVDRSNPNLEGTYSPWKGYGHAKLANYHFALGLQREFERHRVRAESLVAHPGLSNTNLQAHTVEQGAGGVVATVSHFLARHTGMSPAQGALPQLRAATDPDAKGGEMYAPRFINNGAPVRRPILRRIGLDAAIDALWDVSEQMTGVAIEFDGGPRQSDDRDLSRPPDD
jgi:NAD(P)-dependent dehydrogenase (short-subunit alcohol dehydrogenase family)